MSKYFIGTYTNWCKEYCDHQFFERLGQLRDDSPVVVVDNTDPSKHNYASYLSELMFKLCPNQVVHRVHWYQAKEDHQFHYNVEASASLIRERFLSSDLPYLLLVESDVIPPVDLLTQLDTTIAKLPSDWGILGCLYYDGFHDYSKTGIHETNHALSGCTVYRREVIERYPFRVSAENWAAFPDAWICHDVNSDAIYRIFNDHDIRCEHLHYQGVSRQSKPL
ncbi:hypothetical protein [Chitinophaga japonensis]|uniref:Glycosyl transferase family 2 n=1 Tax=Chitinophaga japonensis TaxID=104662 RepID=A0A562SY85_CHIJA|nr:hypothetical protein [Chitinophaga japonensis]TWI86309.1 hypothetical protein LX66_3563 [Chitinophaga japonensis]